MPRFKEQAVCIRHLDWSETSQIVALLTEGRGVIRAVAKGSKRSSPSHLQRFSGGVELLTLGQAVGLAKPSAELANLTEWDLQQAYRHVRHDLAAQHLGLYAADLIGAMLAPADAHPNVFVAMCDFLESLREAEERGAALLKFQWILLTDCGYRPQLHRDAAQDTTLTEANAYTFDARAGGLTVRESNENTAWRVRRKTVDLLRSLDNSDKQAVLVEHDALSIERANRLLCVYLRAILDRELPTMKYVPAPR